MCTLATALSEGRLRATTLMCGLVLGCWLWILLLAAGVASFFTSHPAVMTSIQAVGVAYIAYLALGAFREAAAGFGRNGVDALKPASACGWRLIARGVLMSMSNPLTILFFLAFLPNFTTKEAAFPPAVQVLLLGTLFCALVPFIYFPVILAADCLRARLMGSAKFSVGLKLASALMLAAVAAILLAQML